MYLQSLLINKISNFTSSYFFPQGTLIKLIHAQKTIQDEYKQ